MSKPKIQRNKDILRLRDKRRLSFGLIGEKFGIDKKTAWDIYVQEKKRRGETPLRVIAKVRKKRSQKVIPK